MKNNDRKVSSAAAEVITPNSGLELSVCDMGRDRLERPNGRKRILDGGRDNV